MGGFLQEKNQISAPPKPESGKGWASDDSARQRTAVGQFQPLPPGMSIANQDFSEQPQMPLVLSGENDVSADSYKPAALEKGFARLDMKGTDDLYTGEHTDLFYSDAGGFCERNNYLDRN